ncbi:ABC transporter permease [Acuticoccus sp.]|uniref:ABC transporter permease n=1 Tax=Acuticoccus sp. TaxID=1904378 RepID=UPI003B518BB8
MSSGSGANAYLLVPIALLGVLLSTAVIRGPNLVTQTGVGSAIIVAAPLILATYALMALAIAGRGTVDLAVGPLLAFVNVSIVRLNDLGLVTTPIGVFALALGIGALYQVLFALIIITVRVQPIIVALSGFLALSGINLVILPRPGGTAPEWMFEWGFGITIFTPILAIVVLATGGWLLFTLTPFYQNLRLMGYDERAAFTSGVRTNGVRIGAHVIAGIFVGLGAICYTGLIGSGDPTQGTTLTLTAITAVVLGGVSLAGGRGNVIGALLGAINLFLIGYVLATFNFGAIQAFVTQLAYGLILVLSLLLTLLVPILARSISFISPYSAAMALGTVVLSIMLHVGVGPVTAPDASPGALAAGTVDGSVDRYTLVAPPRAAEVGEVAAGPLTRVALPLVLALGLLTLVARVAVAEALSLRFGVFVYVCISLMILALFAVVADRSAAQALPWGCLRC